MEIFGERKISIREFSAPLRIEIKKKWLIFIQDQPIFEVMEND